jgi:predicted phosphate transport protein (TIGR00153 family)
MAVGSPLGKLFGASPIRPLQEHMRLADAAVRLLGRLVREALDGDRESMRALSLELQSAAQDARALQADLHEHLPRGLFLAMPRPDLLHLLEAQQQLTEGARQSARGLLFRPLAVPGPARKSLESLLGRAEGLSALVLTAVESTDELLETGFGGAEARKVERQLDSLERRVLQHEKQADKLRTLLLRAEADSGPLDAAFNYRLVDALDDLAHRCGEIGERLRLLLAR